MKKRGKGLLALWLALVMAVSLPVTTFAATTSDVYFYIGTEALNEGKQVASEELELLTGNEAFKVDTPLSEQFSSKIPIGYNVTGWNLWKADSGFYVSSAIEMKPEGSISQGDFDNYFQSSVSDGDSYSEDIRYVVVEPLLELSYKITHQPTNAEPYVLINEEDEEFNQEEVVSTYEWYSVQTEEYSVGDIVSIQDGDGNYDETLDTWSGISFDDEKYSLSLSVGGMTVGDILQITPIENADIEIGVESIDGFSLSKNEDGVWTGTILSQDYSFLYITSSNAFSVNIKGMHEEVTLVDGQNTSVFSGPNGTYFCKVIFTNGASLNSEVFTYTRHDITSTTSSNGSYKLQVSGADVEKAAPGDTVTVVATPETGYELGTVTVTKTDDTDGSTAPVMVTDGTFTMPDYPVTVSVTFKKLTYEVTLPTDTVGYSVEEMQDSPVEHGSDYTFIVTINGGYAASGNFEVKANNTLLTATDVNENVYIYTIKNITAAQEITVTGVAEKYDITKTAATGGSYTVTADSIEVTEAIKDTKITIEAQPSEGYELDMVTVTKTDDSNTEVTVTNNSFTMPDYPVTVSVTFKKLTYAVTLPTKTVGYTVESTQDSLVEHGSDYTFTVTISNGYAASENFSVNANNTKLTATSVNGNVYTYTINNVTVATEITVFGVLDATAPVVTITLDENNLWQSFLNKISFELFFKEEMNFTIDATDAESGIRTVEYYLADTDLFPEDKTYAVEDIENSITGWTEYKESISLSEDRQYVLYVKATDQDGNVSYASTAGIVIDTTAPIISGIKDGETYYGDTSFTVSDEYLKSVTIDGKQVQPDGGSYTVTADNSSHTVVAEDQAGNSITYVVSVYETYDVALPKETVGYTVESTQTSPVNYGSDYTFKVTISDGYAASENFAVNANNNVLTVTDVNGNVYTYTIKNVTEAQEITVTGVKDATAPVVTITLDENNLWQSFLNKITFGLFFKEEKSLTIDATDAESEIKSVEYYLTDTDLFPEDKTYTAEEIENSITGWTEYKESISLSEDDTYVLYAKAEDQAGNVSYASTTGIVVDTMLPVISGIKDGGTYYGDTSFTISDNYLKTVTVDDGEPVAVDSSPYTDKITADNGTHTVTAVDQAGNSVSYSILVYKTYTVTLLQGTGYQIESSQDSQVNYGSDFTFTVKLEDGYSAAAGLEVREGSNVLTGEQESETVYTYTIEEVMEDKTVTVSGIVPVITKSGATGGNYTVTVDNQEVTAVARDTVVTITPTPAEGYEPDTVTVTKTGDSNTVVTVTNNSFTMPDYPVTVDVIFKKKTYAVMLPQGQKAYTVTSEQTSPVEHDDNYTFNVTISDGYVASENFAVNANNNVLTATAVNGNVHTYTISNITEAQEITVTGVVDVTAPMVTITLDENNLWQSFLNKISFGLFFKEEESLTIDATDAESGIQTVEYYLTDTDLFPEDKTYTVKEIESAIPIWKAYTESISLPEDGQYVLYAKATDQEGNVSYASTTGIVIDTISPIISGIENGGTYYGDILFTISDDNLDKVTVDGNALELTDTTTTITITADCDTHTIQAADKAGNQISYQVSVYEKWMKDGISSGGVYYLKSGIPYTLGSGKWKVVGDDTIYEGGNTFYVQESGDFEFQKQ